ncbi:MAG: rane protein [Pseudonocardiales bacterium]|jgi:membrane protein|nr:rane protein [Pseudonocardiales bacterium]
MGPGERISSVKDRACEAWRSVKERRPGIAHIVRGYQHYKKNHGDHLAAAITYFSFLALFPLILLGVSVVGFVLASHADLQAELLKDIAKNVPGDFGRTVQTSVDSAVRNRTSVGLVGLVGVALAGLGWIANLRTAIDTVWGLPEAKRSFVRAKLADALVLIGLGLGVLISIALTAGGTSASGVVLRSLHLDDVTGAGILASVLGILLGVLGSSLIFGWLLIRLPDVEVSRHTAIQTTLLAAVGFEILKVVGTIYIARATQSPAVAIIAPVLGILIWIDLVSRYLLYCVAWAATDSDTPGSQREPLAEDLASVPVEPIQGRRPAVSSVSPIGIAAGLIGAGAAIGGACVAGWQRRHRRAQEVHQP